jgi:ectoine hydroxylase-related dioxygenase (phytanoyl-CoA dioxygenase family)
MLTTKYEPAGLKLSATELAAFHESGFVGPYLLLAEPEAVVIYQASQNAYPIIYPKAAMRTANKDAFEQKYWFKSLHMVVPTIREVAIRPAIRDRVQGVLGPDVLLWGSTVIVQQPGQSHRWHVDVEHSHWPGITVFVALQNVSEQSTLSVVRGSHKLHDSPQSLKATSSRAALQCAQAHLSTAELVPLVMDVGEFYIFHGRIWHGSQNTTNDVRVSLLLQFTKPTSRVRIPLTWDEPIRWHPTPPPCLLVSGKPGRSRNRLVY